MPGLPQTGCHGAFVCLSCFVTVVYVKGGKGNDGEREEIFVGIISRQWAEDTAVSIASIFRCPPNFVFIRLNHGPASSSTSPGDQLLSQAANLEQEDCPVSIVLIREWIRPHRHDHKLEHR